jgi:hypothetical protein
MTFRTEGQQAVCTDGTWDPSIPGSAAVISDTIGGSFPKKRFSGSTSSSSTVAPLSPKSLHTDSPPDMAATGQAAGQTQGLLSTPKPDGVLGVFVNDCPPSPELTKKLLAHAQTRKRAGRHNLVPVTSGSTQRVLRLAEVLPKSQLSQQPPIDRGAIPNDLYESLLSSANVAKKNGQHKIVRRRLGLCGELESVLVLSQQSSTVSAMSSMKKSYSSIFSPDPALF